MVSQNLASSVLLRDSLRPLFKSNIQRDVIYVWQPMEKMLTFVRTLMPAKKAETAWADRFVGAWKDDRTADEIVNEIRSARTINQGTAL